MSNDFIDEINMNYLINRKMQKRNTLLVEAKKDKKDKYFYRKRIISLVKELLSSNSDDIKIDTLLLDVEEAFNIFAKICVNYFKTIDKTDIIQEEYKDLNFLNDYEFSDDTNIIMCAQENIDSEMLLSSKKMNNSNNNTLDNFVKKINIKKENNIILPQKKNINLKDPTLKNKGIVKKKNINNKYEAENCETENCEAKKCETEKCETEKCETETYETDKKEKETNN